MTLRIERYILPELAKEDYAQLMANVQMDIEAKTGMTSPQSDFAMIGIMRKFLDLAEASLRAEEGAPKNDPH